jgi:hypothetical protein
MSRMKTVGLLLSLAATVIFCRAYFVVSSAVGYGIQAADRNQKLFLLAAIVSAVASFGFAASLYWRARQSRQVVEKR